MPLVNKTNPLPNSWQSAGGSTDCCQNWECQFVCRRSRSLHLSLLGRSVSTGAWSCSGHGRGSGLAVLRETNTRSGAVIDPSDRFCKTRGTQCPWWSKHKHCNDFINRGVGVGWGGKGKQWFYWSKGQIRRRDYCLLSTNPRNESCTSRKTVYSSSRRV